MSKNAPSSEPTIFDWGAAPPSAPSIKRADPLGWLMASATMGAVAAVVGTALVWRAFPGISSPPGMLSEHIAGLWSVLMHALWPPAYGQDSKTYLKIISELPEGAKQALVWRGCVGAWAALMMPVLLYKSYMTPRDSLIHMRGAMRHEGAEAVAHLNASLATRVKRRPDHPIAPGVPYPADMWTRHMLVVGGVGSGKSTAIKPLIEKVIAAGESMILFDPKGEFTMGFASPALIAPWDRRSCSWDIGKDMRNIGDMRRFAAAMIREGTDPMWANASRQILVGFMIYLTSTRGTRWGWRELADLVAIPQGSLLPLMSQYHPEAIRAVERASVTTHGILINLSSFCSSIFDLAQAWGDVPEDRRISFVEWTKQKGRHKQVILQGHGAYPELTRGYVEGIVGVISAMVNSVEMEDDPNRKLWFIADEFGQMGKIPIRPLFEVGRSRGVRCVVACQDLAQLEEVHGASMVKALVSMSGTLLVGQMMQGDTAEQMAKALGSREVERANISSSYAGTGGSSNRSSTLSFARDELAVYKPSELASRLGLTPDGLGVKLALFTGGHAYELYWPHHTMNRARIAHMPALWTKGFGALQNSSDGVQIGMEGSQGNAEPSLSMRSMLVQDSMDSQYESHEEPAGSREGLEVVALEDDRKRPNEAESHEAPITAALTEQILDHVGANPMAVALSLVEAAEASIDHKPGPTQVVQSVQRSPSSIPAGSSMLGSKNAGKVHSENKSK